MNPFFSTIFDPTFYLCNRTDNTYEFKRYPSSYDADMSRYDNTQCVQEISWYVPTFLHKVILESRLANSIATITHN